MRTSKVPANARSCSRSSAGPVVSSDLSSIMALVQAIMAPAVRREAPGSTPPAVAGLRLAGGRAGQHGACSGVGVERVRPAPVAAILAVRAVDLDDANTVAGEVTGERYTVGAWALDPDPVEITVTDQLATKAGKPAGVVGNSRSRAGGQVRPGQQRDAFVRECRRLPSPVTAPGLASGDVLVMLVIAVPLPLRKTGAARDGWAADKTVTGASCTGSYEVTRPRRRALKRHRRTSRRIAARTTGTSRSYVGSGLAVGARFVITVVQSSMLVASSTGC